MWLWGTDPCMEWGGGGGGWFTGEGIGVLVGLG
jgi:hypothetical protein